MKIGIITFHRAHNYGAVLQCYALKETISRLGHEVEIIDYLPHSFAMEYSLFSKEKLKLLNWKGKIVQFCKSLRLGHIHNSRANLFERFINNHLQLSQAYTDDSVLEFHYDMIFFGSDQIWNPSLTNGFDTVYTGKFPKNNSRFIAYAASSRLDVAQNYNEEFAQLIERFDAISTREQDFANYLCTIKSNCASVVLDPVLLLSRDKWTEIAIKPQEDKYLLVYTVPQHPNIRLYADGIAKKMGLRVIELTPKPILSHRKGLRQIVSPEEFVGYFKYSSYIVTSSFHGTAFAIKFQKPFNTMMFGTSVDARAHNLLNSLKLGDREVLLNNIIENIEAIDYNHVDIELQNMIENSHNFILRNI